MRRLSGSMLALLFVFTWMLTLDIGSVGREFSMRETASLDSVEEQVVALVNGSRVYDYDLELEDIAFQSRAFRAGGSPGANDTANWITQQFEGFGLETWLEPFEFTTWDLLDDPFLVADDDGDIATTNDQTMIQSFQCTHFSWPTPDGGVFADLVVLPLPYVADYGQIGSEPIDMSAWNMLDITGKVVLVGREIRWNRGWEETYTNKLFDEPPAAVVYTWWYDWMSFTPPMLSSAGGRPLSGFGPYYWDLEIPVGFVNYEDGFWLRSREQSLDVSAHFCVNSTIGSGTHYNVVGRIMGQENPDKYTVISCHYDTVMCSGFCDNGAGTAAVIELAGVFSRAVDEQLYSPPYTLLFVAFASEELGLVGSVNYVAQHKSEMADIKVVLNLDCIGSDDFFASETAPVNGFDLDQVIAKAAQDIGIAVILGTGGGDEASFVNPSQANDMHYRFWRLDAGISDAAPVPSSTILASYPLMYRDLWYMGTPGWIHTVYDNSTSTETLNWVEAEDLENHIKVAALAAMRSRFTSIYGDINWDGIVDIFDAILLAGAYGSNPGDSDWNAVADVNGDNIVDIYDAIVLANNYGQTE